MYVVMMNMGVDYDVKNLLFVLFLDDVFVVECV